MGVLSNPCGLDMYYDNITDSCTYCSELCDLADIQDTWDLCEGKCPGFLSRAVSTTATTFSDHTAALVFGGVMVMLVVAALVGGLVYRYRKSLVSRLKKQDFCRDGLSAGPYAQETQCEQPPHNIHGTSVPLLNPDNTQGYPDVPNR